MHRIDGSGHQDNHFTEGNPQTGTEATVVTADWLNSVQEEVAHVIESQNLALDKDDNEQLKIAVNSAINKAVDDCKVDVAQERVDDINAAKIELRNVIDDKITEAFGVFKQRHIIRFSMMGYVKPNAMALIMLPGVDCKVVSAGVRVSGSGSSARIMIKNNTTAFYNNVVDSVGVYLPINGVNLIHCSHLNVEVVSIGGSPYDLRGYLIVEEN